MARCSQRQFAQIIVALNQYVEGAELKFMITLARMQRVEVRRIINAEDGGLVTSTNRFRRTLYRSLAPLGNRTAPYRSDACYPVMLLTQSLS